MSTTDRLCVLCRKRTRYGRSLYCKLCGTNRRRVLHRARARLRYRDPVKREAIKQSKARSRKRIKDERHCISCGAPIGSNLGSKYCKVCKPER